MNKISILLATSFILISCLQNQQSVNAFNSEENFTNTSKHIPFSLAANYFVRNDVRMTKSLKPYIDNKKDFDLIFGVARTMSTEGKPTMIDFSKEIVIPIILQETNKGTTIKVKDIYLNGDKIKVDYVIKETEPLSYIIQPSEVILIQRKHLKNLNQLKFEFEKIREL